MTRKRLLMFFFHVIIIFIVNLISCDEITIANYGMIFLLYSSFSFLCLVSIQKKIVSPINILYGTFVLFQAGVPIAFFIKENYSNYYITLFSAEMVLAAAKYTLWSIEAFCFFYCSYIFYHHCGCYFAIVCICCVLVYSLGVLTRNQIFGCNKFFF